MKTKLVFLIFFFCCRLFYSQSINLGISECDFYINNKLESTGPVSFLYEVSKSEDTFRMICSNNGQQIVITFSENQIKKIRTFFTQKSISDLNIKALYKTVRMGRKNRDCDIKISKNEEDHCWELTDLSEDTKYKLVFYVKEFAYINNIFSENNLTQKKILLHKKIEESKNKI